MSDPTQRITAVIGDFSAALAILSGVLQFIEDAKPAAELRVVMQNNTIVALTSTIEEALRGLFQEYLSVLEGAIEDHRKLPQEVQKSNLGCAIQSMKKHNSDSDFKAAAILVSNLDKCLNGQPGYQLLKEQIAYNQSNFKSKQVTDISKSVGIANLWSRICDCPEVEEYTGEVNLETRVTRLTAKWNELFDERDLVVHRMSQANGWSADSIRQSIYLSEMVLTRISQCLATDGGKLTHPAAYNNQQ